MNVAKQFEGLIDSTELRCRLTALVADGSDGGNPAIRSKVLAILKEVRQETRAHVQKLLLTDKRGVLLVNTGNGKAGTWKYRDHGLFVCFAPVDNPRYAASVVIEHGMGGSRAAAPVAKDIFTFLYDRQKAMDALEALEAGWGGTIKDRMDRDYAAWKAGASMGPDPESAP